MAIHEWIAKGAVSDDIAKQRGYIELVRCKDCKWYVQNRMFQCGAHCIPVKNSDWFCADGELKQYEVKQE